MFTNRRGRREVNKQVYNNNQLSINTGNVGIRRDKPQSALDVNGNVNTSQKYTINYVPIAPPVGSIMAYTMGISPDGWLICNGASYSKITYGALFQVIGDAFGATDTSFNVPDYQGTFLRGIGVAPVTSYVGPININTPQLHATQTHNHTASSVVDEEPHTHIMTSQNDDYNDSGGNTYDNNTSPPVKPSFATWDSAGNVVWPSDTISSNTTGISVGTTVNNSTLSVNANETRPYNYGVYWIIKY